MKAIILASGSAARAAMLEAAGVTFEIRFPGVDESALKEALMAEGAPAGDIADALAEAKTVKVSRRAAGLVLGADQILEVDGILMDKPGSREGAAAALRTLRGRNHRLHAAAVIAEGGVPIWRVVRTVTLKMRDISDAFLEDYLEREGEAIFGCVGAYRLEGRGAQLFERIDGDYFTVLGLPLLDVLDILRRHGALPL
jgi:septum formation protein